VTASPPDGRKVSNSFTPATSFALNTPHFPPKSASFSRSWTGVRFAVATSVNEVRFAKRARANFHHALGATLATASDASCEIEEDGHLD